MTFSLLQLRDHVADKFPDVELVNDSTLRFMKKLDGNPYAVYYFDITQNLPESKEALAKYQDQVIGTKYFNGRKSLQWSNYLYFITQSGQLESGELRKAKELIERDRSYARKFVIPVEDIDSILSPPVVAPAVATPHANVLAIWAERLAEAGLDKAILNDKDLPTRLKLIEASNEALTTNAKIQKRTNKITTETFIRSLHLNKYRDCPHQRDFTFGTVNLIFGANGSGKTSLLEAIELLYCGKNKRNPKARPHYEMNAGFADGRTELVTANRELQVFRNRNLVWYGQPETNTQNLYQSFAQYNFLDTDAAVSLADSVSRIEDDLSKLLVGPDASKTWRDMERVLEAVVGKLRDLHLLETQINVELTAMNKQIEDSKGIRQESDSINARLKEMTTRVGWSHYKTVDGKFAINLLEALSEFISIVQQATTLNWMESPVSINVMDDYCRMAIKTSEEVSKNFVQLGLLQRAQKNLSDSINRDREILETAKEAKRIIDSGVHTRSEERNKLQILLATYSETLAGIDTDSLRALFPNFLDIKLSNCHEDAFTNRATAKSSLANSKTEYQNFCKLRDQSLNLIQELRQIATRIVHESSKPNECPLCHTNFEQGELSRRINMSGDDHLDSLGNTLLNQIQEREGALREAINFEAVLASLMKFCERAKLPKDVSIRSVLDKVAEFRKKLLEAQDELVILKNELLALESQGLSLARMENISGRLHEFGYTNVVSSLEAIDQLIINVTSSVPKLINDLANKGTAIEKLRLVLAESLGSTGSDDSELKNMHTQIKERVALTESLLVKLSHFSTLNFPWPGDRSLAELVVEAESIRIVAADLQIALSKEKLAKDSYIESSTRKDSLQKQLVDLQIKLNRYKEAQNTLKSITSKHSLKSAMDSALQENRESIESIFKSIHSPVEFSGLGSSWTTLVRQLDGSEAKLSEISTGQRAAFALSIFLAQNIQLKDAPPVVLIDDPIAHVDDLNSLSFLDYLREIVLKGKRQIFFATADDKLASLFQRKFDFLGPDEFFRINLNRES